VKYIDLCIDLALDLVGLYLLTVTLYYRRHRRGDLLLSYISLNVGLFVTMSLLGSVRVDIATGFGLFAILSIIQLRSSTVQQQETAYYFAVLVLGLVNGLRLPDRLITVLLDAAVIGTIYVVDSRRLFTRSQHIDVVLDVIHPEHDTLIADLERRLQGTVVHFIVEDIDYVRGTMNIDVRYVPDAPARQAPAPIRVAPDWAEEISGATRLR
jgi:hypothetical protein